MTAQFPPSPGYVGESHWSHVLEPWYSTLWFDSKGLEVEDVVMKSLILVAGAGFTHNLKVNGGTVSLLNVPFQSAW
jgi:hypothetical protein